MVEFTGSLGGGVIPIFSDSYSTGMKWRYGMTLLDLIEEFLFTHYMSETQFGRVCLNDSRLIGDLRRGRQPMMHTREKILKFIEEHEG